MNRRRARLLISIDLLEDVLGLPEGCLADVHRGVKDREAGTVTLLLEGHESLPECAEGERAPEVSAYDILARDLDGSQVVPFAVGPRNINGPEEGA